VEIAPDGGEGRDGVTGAIVRNGITKRGNQLRGGKNVALASVTALKRAKTGN